MKQFENFNNNAEETVSFNNIIPGIYLCKINYVEDVIQKEYLKIEFDIVKGDFEKYFEKIAKNNGGIWSFAGTTYRSYKQSAQKFFESFITAIRKSNDNYVWNWNEKSLENKYFVGVFGEEEYLSQDGTEIKKSVRLQEIRSVIAFKNNELKVPELKKLSVKDQTRYDETVGKIADAADTPAIFGDLPIENVEDLPF